MKFMETSAKANVNVEDAFVTLARDIKVKMDKKLVRCLMCAVKWLTSSSCFFCFDVIVFMAASRYYYYHYATLNVPCVGHKDDESQVQMTNRRRNKSRTGVCFVQLTAILLVSEICINIQ